MTYPGSAGWLVSLALLLGLPAVGLAQVPDRDGDGIPDDRDACPGVPEDRDGFEDEDGCPDPDNDRDGIPDIHDKCPNDPENYNGYQDEDGCPDRPVVRIRDKHPPSQVVLTFPSGGASVLKRHRNLLEMVAKVMREHARVELVEVQGHADDPGSRAANQRLSQRRAEAVRRALTKLGVAPKRLVAKGYGLTQPVASGRRARDRALNRRVSFKILRLASPSR